MIKTEKNSGISTLHSHYFQQNSINLIHIFYKESNHKLKNIFLNFDGIRDFYFNPDTRSVIYFQITICTLII